MLHYPLYAEPTLREEIARVAQEAFRAGYRELPYYRHKQVECMPVVDWWDVSPSRDGSQRLYLYKGRKNYYIHYWTNFVFDGSHLDWCLVVPKRSSLGQQITELIRKTSGDR